MKAFSQKLGIALAGLLLAAGPALAQDDRGRPAGGGDRGGSTASTAGGGGGGGSTTSSSGGGGGGSTSSSSGGGGLLGTGPFLIPSVPIAPPPRADHSPKSAPKTAPRGGDQKAAPRPASGGPPASEGAPGWVAGVGLVGERIRERAESRGTGTGSREEGGSRRNTESTSNPSDAKEVTNWSRPRGDRPATDIAVPRTGPRPPRDSDERNRERDRPRYDGDIYPPVYVYPTDPYYALGFDSGCGLYSGYYGYPFYSPYGFGYGLPSGFCDPFYTSPDVIGPDYSSPDQGSLKLKMKPRNAKVYVDGYYVGVVDEFDGAFQKLKLDGGRHKVEIRAEGYETTEFDVLVTPRHTVTFTGQMKKAQ